MGGYRYFRFREALTIQEQVIARDPGGFVAFGTIFDLADRFTTENNFHGGELGVVADYYRDIFTLEILAKVALGNIRRRTTISGESTVTPPPLAGPMTMAAGGLLSQPTNIGTHTNDDFAVLPEFGVNLRMALTNSATLSVGYTLLMLNGVARTGEQIDPVINSDQIGGGAFMGDARPSPLFADSDFWAQGLQLGIMFER
jgi:hypothetical protein